MEVLLLYKAPKYTYQFPSQYIDLIYMQIKEIKIMQTKRVYSKLTIPALLRNNRLDP